ncbi:hypothetical protein FRB96_005478 [Tulasnella sp. 330]|nr:hypothetical protein FRB96_005478 [Tulasnella sp. 330]
MLEDLLYNSDGFHVVELLRGQRAGLEEDIKASLKPRIPLSTLSNNEDSSSIALVYLTPSTYRTHHITLAQASDMSLSRSLFNEFRPIFRMLADEPFSRPFPPRLTASRFHDDPFDAFFGSGFSGHRSAAVDLKEEEGQYILSAELPGVKKENLEVHVGDNGRSITIQGGTLSKSVSAPESPATQSKEEPSSRSSEGTTLASPQQDNHDLSSRSEVTQANYFTDTTTNTKSLQDRDGWVSRSTFSRTVWLPHRVDASKVSGKLEDGILRLSIPKLEGQDRLKVNVE